MPLFKANPSRKKYRKITQNNEPKGLMVTFPEDVIRAKGTTDRKLWYDLYTPRSYMVKQAQANLYLQLPSSYIRGNGCIHFNPNLPNSGYNRQKKCMRINKQ